MKKHTKIYLDFMEREHSLLPHEILCEVCSKKAVDIHHISPKGMGGSKLKDTIDNLMAVCRSCHEKYGDKKQFVDFLKKQHSKWLK